MVEELKNMFKFNFQKILMKPLEKQEDADEVGEARMLH
jgi:hypothetical protein